MLPSEGTNRGARLISALPDVLSGLVLLAAIVTIFAAHRDYGIGRGDHVIAWFTSGFEDETALSFRRDCLYGGAFEALGSIVRKWSTIDKYDSLAALGVMVPFLLVTRNKERRGARPKRSSAPRSTAPSRSRFQTRSSSIRAINSTRTTLASTSRANKATNV